MYERRTELILFIDSLSAANVLFIYSAVGSRSEAPAGGLGDGVPQKLEHF